MSDHDDSIGDDTPTAPPEWHNYPASDTVPEAEDDSILPSGSAELDDLVARAKDGSQNIIHAAPVDSELLHGENYDEAEYTEVDDLPYTLDETLPTADESIEEVIEYVPDEPGSTEVIEPIDYTVTSEPIEPTLLETKLLHLDQVEVHTEFQSEPDPIVVVEGEAISNDAPPLDAEVPIELGLSEEVPFMGSIASPAPSKPAYSRVEALTAAIQQRPNAPVNYVLRGEALLDDRNDTEALADFQTALNLIRSRAKTVSWEYIDRALADRAREGLRRVRR